MKNKEDITIESFVANHNNMIKNHDEFLQNYAKAVKIARRIIEVDDAQRYAAIASEESGFMFRCTGNKNKCLCCIPKPQNLDVLAKAVENLQKPETKKEVPLVKTNDKTVMASDFDKPAYIDNPVPGYIEDAPEPIKVKKYKKPLFNWRWLGPAAILAIVVAITVLKVNDRRGLVRDKADMDRKGYLTVALEDMLYEYENMDDMNPLKRRLNAEILNYQTELNKIKQRQRQ
ncbi:MAG: hypothetical protein FWC83_00340 [Alphaproteobacteria bacterium]|nr:hypothetical protein [Alphaproteobacteria bacterium]